MTEQVIIVDEFNNEIGSVKRSKMRDKKLWHRGTSILVVNKKKEIFIHQRQDFKDLFPLHFDMFFGGVVEVGETNHSNAKKELFEEAGIDKKPNYLFTELIVLPSTKVFTSVYHVQYDGELTLQDEEVKEGYFVSLNKLKQLLHQKQFCPDSLILFERLKQGGYIGKILGTH